MSDERAIGSICIAGGGIVGLSAALAFARALPQCEISLITTAADPAALADRLPSLLPSSRRFHAQIGIDERELVSRGIATHRLGTCFEDWSASGAPWVLAFGEYGLPADGLAFHQLWARAAQTGKGAPFDAYSLAAALGAAGKFVHPQRQAGSPLAGIDYALRVDPDLYAALLRERVAELPVRTMTGRIAAIERGDGGRVTAVMLDEDRRVTADLYLDCTGPQQLLSGGTLPGHQREDWQGWSRFNTITIAQVPQADWSTLDDIAADADGWRATFPLGASQLRVVAGPSGDRDEAEGTPVAIAPGRSCAPWQGNIVALGDAAIALDPALPVHLSLAHNAIGRALDLLPGRSGDPPERAEYNRLALEEGNRVRDFAALLYLRSGRSDGVWADLSDRAPSDSLALTLDQFAARGRLPFFEQELFDSHGWLAALAGLGIRQQRIDPVAARIAPDVAEAAMARLAASYRAIADAALPYPAYRAQMVAAARR